MKDLKFEPIRKVILRERLFIHQNFNVEEKLS
jgi:hypothetical protein